MGYNKLKKDNTNEIYRVRPVNENTFDELEKSYLWFSKRKGFRGDSNDANIGAFMNDTDAIKRGFKYLFPQSYKSFFEQIEQTEFCCFTNEMPDDARVKRFPNCSNGKCICVVYDRKKLEQFFLMHEKIYPCFIPVVYDNNPTRLETDGEWSILWEEDDNGKLYKTIPGMMYEGPQILDEFIRRLFTRISSKFKNQKEERIVLGGSNIPNYDENKLGCQILIPEEVIKRIIVYPNVEEADLRRMYAIPSVKEKMMIQNKELERKLKNGNVLASGK